MLVLVGELFGFGTIHFISREAKTLTMNSEHVAAAKCEKNGGKFSMAERTFGTPCKLNISSREIAEK